MSNRKRKSHKGKPPIKHPDIYIYPKSGSRMTPQLGEQMKQWDQTEKGFGRGDFPRSVHSIGMKQLPRPSRKRSVKS